MRNRDKFKDEICAIALDGFYLGVDFDGKPFPCTYKKEDCKKCSFRTRLSPCDYLFCAQSRRYWLAQDDEKPNWVTFFTNDRKRWYTEQKTGFETKAERKIPNRDEEFFVRGKGWRGMVAQEVFNLRERWRNGVRGWRNSA